jgi:retron-type reverse transcriptase
MTPIVTVDDLAKALGIPKYALTRYVFKANRLYKTFRIGKPSGHGYRTINAPSAELKGLQRWIVRNVLRAVKLHIAASAFRPGCSIVNNAKPHAGHDFVFNADLRDYFPSITSRRIFGLFRALGFANELAAAFTRLTTRAGELPQGAPTSPELANIIARRLDSRLDGLCQRCGWRYTRYCDDITVSGNGVFGGAKRVIEAIIASEGFEVNTKKTRVHRRGQSQMVTGLVVNEFPNVPRSQRHRWRAIFHQASLHPDRFGGRSQELRGYVSFLRMVHPSDAAIARYETIICACESGSLATETKPPPAG